MAESKGEGVLTKIVVGAGTTVAAAIALYYLGLTPNGEKKTAEKPAPPPPVQNMQPASDADLRARQAELEKKIDELSKTKKETVQTGIAQIEARAEEARKTAPADAPARKIAGTWYAPSTGSAYVIRQDGSLVTIQEYTAQVITAYAQGTLQGRRVDFEFYSTVLGIRGKGWLETAADGGNLSITVVNPVTGDRVTNDLQPAE